MINTVTLALSANDDPRKMNCRKFVLDANGKVIGVELQVEELPNSKYKLGLVELIDENNASGNTVASYLVHNSKGFPVSETVLLAWPWPNLTTTQKSGNPNNQHMITNGYNPPNLGPLAMYVADDKGNPISDIVGGLGLPINRHVCYNMVWVERGFDDTTGGNGNYNAQLSELLVEVKKLNRHLGVV